jgi:GPI mannosyltransferase 1 subunit M
MATFSWIEKQSGKDGEAQRLFSHRHRSSKSPSLCQNICILWEKMKRPKSIIYNASILSPTTLRIILILVCIYQDSHFSTKFTDIDYSVYTDAAFHVSQSNSPYKRATYRYTPLLAYLLVPNVTLHPLFGKLLFCLGDLLAGHLMHRIVPPNNQKYIAWCWLLNPITASISVRGSGESLVACLLLGMIAAIQAGHIYLAGALYGLSVHWRVYPIIFAVPLLRQKRWFAFFFSSAVVFFSLGALFYHLYGWEFLHEAYLYHLTRIDPRHNFSMYFYPAYLEREGGGKVAGMAFSIAQATLQLALGWGLMRGGGGLKKKERERQSMPIDLPAVMAVQTLAFVAFNKVCTAQYFVWVIFLLPSILPRLPAMWGLGSFWLAATSMWLAMGWCLEFAGQPVHLLVWAAGLVFLIANVLILREIVSRCIR